MAQIKTKTLNDICELIVDCEHKTAPTQVKGYPSIRTPNIGRGRLILDNVNRVSEETYKAWTKRAIPQADDLILAREAPIGNVAIIPNNLKVCLGQRTVLIRPNQNKVEPNYLVYLLIGDEIQGKILSVSNGATVHHLNMKDIRNLELPELPSLHTQRKIAAILSAYDDLIENNTRRIEILEEMARSLYREWFVKFRFPGHEQVKMVDSELGLIPEGWKVISLGQILDIKHGYAFKGEYFSKEPTSDILLTPGNFKFGGGFKDDKFKYYKGLVSDEFVLSTSDLLVTMTDLSKEGDTLGYPAFVPPSKELRFLHNQRLGKIILHNPQLGLNHLYHIFCSDSYRHHILASATGATVKHTAPDRIKSFSIALPPPEISNKFETITSSFSRKIILLNQKKQNLRQTRDLLLPKLISGEIDVENLDINTGEIAA
ncbi:restriction endonuclease subunit S [Microcoleus sp. herbarium7]|uniref:restriction endonuclease subunit S n=1 Tax=Microcoleus sp. herbarium7 TaxID=3055435 RepID=UPI002FD5686C